jgi:hypothetical protein
VQAAAAQAAWHLVLCQRLVQPGNVDVVQGGPELQRPDVGVGRHRAERWYRQPARTGEGRAHGQAHRGRPDLSVLPGDQRDREDGTEGAGGQRGDQQRWAARPGEDDADTLTEAAGHLGCGGRHRTAP